MSDEDRALILGKWERGAVAVALLAMGVARVIWPELNIDATTVGLLGGAFAVWKLDIASLEFLGIKARAKRQRLEDAESRLKSLPVAETVRAPASPPAVAPSAESWLESAAAAATDLDPPAEPGVRVLWAGEQARIELTILAGNSGRLPKRPGGWVSLNARPLAQLLVQEGVIDPEITRALDELQEVRNRVAHGQKVSSDILLAADEAAMQLVVTLRSVPREWQRVVESSVSVYEDRARSTLLCVGVMIATLDNDGGVLNRAVFPRNTFLPKGSFVSWEWDGSVVFDQEGWYADPETEESVLAWSRSTLFAGRPYPNEWGLMLRFPRPDVGVDSD